MYPSGRKSSVIQRLQMKENFQRNKSYSGEITQGAKKRLTKAISLLVQSARTQLVRNPVTRKEHPFTLSFVTLTIPECVTKPDAKFCNKFLLEPFLRVLRRRYSLKNYVWKLEIQSNGMIHYHLTSNLFTNHVNIRNEWNAILRRNGLLADYKKRTGNDDPNSTDIHSVKKVKDMEAYLIKYVSKNDQNTSAANSKIWDCSKNLKESSYFSTDSDWSYNEKLDIHEKQGYCKCFTGDRYRIYKYRESAPRKLLTAQDYKSYIIHLNSIRNGKTAKEPITEAALHSSSTSIHSGGQLCAGKDIPNVGVRDQIRLDRAVSDSKRAKIEIPDKGCQGVLFKWPIHSGNSLYG